MMFVKTNNIQLNSDCLLEYHVFDEFQINVGEYLESIQTEKRKPFD
jgi:hypothetical protein